MTILFTTLIISSKANEDLKSFYKRVVFDWKKLEIPFSIIITTLIRSSIANEELKHFYKHVSHFTIDDHSGLLYPVFVNILSQGVL